MAPARQPGCSPLSRGGAAPNSLFKDLEEQPGCVCFGSKMLFICSFSLILVTFVPVPAFGYLTYFYLSFFSNFCLSLFLFFCQTSFGLNFLIFYIIIEMMKKIEIINDKELLNILHDVKEEIHQLFGDKLRRLILYGSYARNEQDPESDIDIMIMVDESEDGLRKYRYLIADVMGELTIRYGKLISLTEVTYNRYNDFLEVLPFYKNINEEGIEIYGRKAA
jgi:predicted nucleotidyltransferase